MQINSTSHNFTNQPFKAAITQEKSRAPEVSTDEVSMSHDALLLTEALRAAQSAPDIRQDKVEALKAAIEAGTYNINCQLIAERIASEETSLFI